VQRVECSGAPRDLGGDQASALRIEIRRAVGAAHPLGWMLALRRDAATTRLLRDLRRHFPHQAEWLEGMARGAGVPLPALVRAIAREAGVGAPPPVVLAAAFGDALRVACPVPPAAVLRRARPEGRFASVELALPASPTPVLAVNEAGLAVAVLPRGSVPGRCAAPAALFARDCLERFERTAPALEWCMARPAARGGALLLADATGERVAVDTDGVRRRVIAAAPALALGAPMLAAPDWWKAARVTSAAELEALLATALASAAPGAGAPAFVDPVGRRLRVPGEDWLPVFD